MFNWPYYGLLLSGRKIAEYFYSLYQITAEQMYQNDVYKDRERDRNVEIIEFRDGCVIPPQSC